MRRFLSCALVALLAVPAFPDGDRTSMPKRLKQVEDRATAVEADVDLLNPWGEEIFYSSRRVTAAEVAALNTTPIALVAGEPGYTIMPTRIRLYHEAGTAYTAASALEVVHFTGSFALFSATSIFEWDARPWQFLGIGPGLSTQYAGTVPAFSGTVGRSIFLRAITADPAGGTFGFDTEIWYTKTPCVDCNMIFNPKFTGSGTGWTMGLAGGAPDWLYSSNTVVHGDSGGTAALEPTQAIPVVAGHTYRVTFTIAAYTAGTVRASVGGTNGTVRGSAATFVEDIVAATTGNFKLTPTTTFAGTIDDVFMWDATAP